MKFSSWQSFLQHQPQPRDDYLSLAHEQAQATIQRLTQQSIVCPLTSFGILQVSGNNAASFLQGQLSYDISAVDEQHAQFGCYCNEKGRVISIFIVSKQEKDYELFMPHSIITETLASLNKYSLFSKVSCQPLTHSWQALGVAGEQAENHLKTLFKHLPKAAYDVSQENALQIIRLAGPITRYLLLGQISALTRAVQQLPAAAFPVNPALWDLLSIQAGQPQLSIQLVGKFTPHTLNLVSLKAISFAKGCYLGQEIIARTEYLGKVKKHLARFSCQHTSPPVELSPLLNADERTVGSVLQWAPSARDNYECLALVEDQALHTNLSVDICDKRFPLKQLHLP